MILISVTSVNERFQLQLLKKSKTAPKSRHKLLLNEVKKLTSQSNSSVTRFTNQAKPAVLPAGRRPGLGPVLRFLHHELFGA